MTLLSQGAAVNGAIAEAGEQLASLLYVPCVGKAVGCSKHTAEAERSRSPETAPKVRKLRAGLKPAHPASRKSN
jgi:hypothetical protein